MTKVRVFIVPGDARNGTLLARLKKIAKFQAEVYTCPKEIATVQPVPFLEVEGGERFYGEEGIKVFFDEEERATQTR